MAKPFGKSQLRTLFLWHCFSTWDAAACSRQSSSPCWVLPRCPIKGCRAPLPRDLLIWAAVALLCLLVHQEEW